MMNDPSMLFWSTGVYGGTYSGPIPVWALWILIPLFSIIVILLSCMIFDMITGKETFDWFADKIFGWTERFL